MQTFNPEERDLFYDVRDQLHADLNRRAEIAFARRNQYRATLKTVADMNACRDAWKANFLRAIGGLPTTRTALNPRMTGSLDTPEFIIEKLMFESLPGFVVTGNCYVPKGLMGRAPAVLLLQGHVDRPYPAYQQLCANLARAGFITFIIDPIGQGERSQYYGAGRFNMMSVNAEHNQGGASLSLHGESIAKYMMWDAIRAIDYLISRPDVDATKIAATGHSGGGIQTLMLMALEDRLVAAAPCAIVTTLHWMMKSAEPVDMEHILQRCMLVGPDYDDLLASMAPRPVIALASSYDRYFPVEGTLEAAEWARRVYEVHGQPDSFKLVVDDVVHEYSQPLREACVNFFLKHLTSKPADFRETPAPMFTKLDLRCTRTGQVASDDPTWVTIADISARIEPPVHAGRSVAQLRSTLDDVLGVSRAGDRTTRIWARLDTKAELNGYPLEKLLFFSAPEIMLSAMICHPRGSTPDEKRPGVLFLIDGGTSAGPRETPRLEAMLNAGNRVIILDTRGTGAVKFRRRVPVNLEMSPWSYLTTEYLMATDAIQLGLTLIGLRVFDTLRCLDYLTTRADLSSISIRGLGQSALYAYFSVALDDRFTSLTTEEMLSAYRLVTQTPCFSNQLYSVPMLPWGILKHFDLPDLLPCFGERKVRMIHPRDAWGIPASPAVVEGLYAKAGPNVEVIPGASWA